MKFLSHLPLPSIALASTLATSQAQAQQRHNALTALSRTTLTTVDPPRGFHGGFVEATGFQINYDRTLSSLWAVQLENNTMFGAQGAALTLAPSDFSTVPGYRLSTDRVSNTDGATRSRQTNITVQGLLNLTCLWPLQSDGNWKAGLMFALGANYSETTDTFIRHDVGSPARPGSTVRVGATHQVGTVSSYRSEIQFRAGAQIRYTAGIFSLRLESFYHVNPRIEGSGPDDGASLTSRLSVNVAPSLGPIQFPIDLRGTLALQRGADHIYFFNPSFELRAGLKIAF